MTNRLIKNIIRVILVTSFIFLTSAVVYADLGDTTLKKGMSSPDVIKLQQSLHELGYFEDDSYTDYFGEATEAAVTKFQKDVGLKKVDGIAGQDTITYINAKLKQKEILPESFSVIKEGDSGKQVADLQTKLKALEMYEGDINSSFDAATKAAVVKFQKELGITPATGTVDEATLVKLNIASDKSYGSRASASRRVTNMQLVELAKKQLGKPYSWGASSGKAFDCSGFVLYIYNSFHVSLPHSASAQFGSGTKVDKASLEPGDLVFFTTYKKGPSHVGIYIGKNKFIHASSGVDRVITSDLGESYYKSRYLGARRYNLTSK